MKNSTRFWNFTKHYWQQRQQQQNHQQDYQQHKRTQPCQGRWCESTRTLVRQRCSNSRPSPITTCAHLHHPDPPLCAPNNNDPTTANHYIVMHSSTLTTSVWSSVTTSAIVFTGLAWVRGVDMASFWRHCDVVEHLRQGSRRRGGRWRWPPGRGGRARRRQVSWLPNHPKTNPNHFLSISNT